MTGQLFQSEDNMPENQKEVEFENQPEPKNPELENELRDEDIETISGGGSGNANDREGRIN
jgi:hypothetical protein